MLVVLAKDKMVTESMVQPQTRRSASQAIVAAGLACGVLDFSAACITWWLRAGVKPIRIGQSIASGLLGPRSFQGGIATSLLGVAIHFLIAFTAATVFYAASRKLKLLTQHVLAAGALYGVAVYIFMYWVVMPLSNVRRGPFSPQLTVIAVVTHIFCVGLPIALAVRKYGA
jgi:hypothetical protein